MSKQNILKGTIILTAAGLITKLLGFYNRIFLTRLIGVKELGIYQLVFPLYLLAFSFCCQGISTTLTKQVSYYIGRHEMCNAKKVFRASLTISFMLSLIVASIMEIFAEPLALNLLKNSDCAGLLKIMAAAIPFVAIKGCINAYFVGTGKAGYHGTSHLVEQTVRITSVFIISEFQLMGEINAKTAVIGVVLGEIASMVMVVIFYMVDVVKTRRNNPEDQFHTKCTTGCSNTKNIMSKFAKDALPLTANNMMLTLFSSLEAIIMPAMLYYYYLDSERAIEMFGVVTGIVIPFLLFPATITSALSTMLLPAVSYAHARNDSRTITTAIKNSIVFCLFLGVCAWIAYLLFGQYTCEVAFKSKEAGILLRKMSYLCPLIYLSGTMSAILNGLDKTFKNLIYNIVSIAIRILCSLIFVPVYGIGAYIIGMTVSYIVLDGLLLGALIRSS